MPRITEHDAFADATTYLGMAMESVKQIANHRPDQRDLWLQLAQTIGITKESLYRLAGDGTLKKGK